jgi:hypothetical protein
LRQLAQLKLNISLSLAEVVVQIQVVEELVDSEQVQDYP